MTNKSAARLNLKNLSLPVVLHFTVLACAGVYIVFFLWIAFTRLSYPYELEWIEGGILNQVVRLLNGESMYVAPGIDYVPFLYPPAYFYLSAAASSVLGAGFLPLRLVSLLASIVSMGIITLIVREETRNSWAAILSAGLFAAAFRVTGAWLDIARVDALFLAFFLLMIYFARKPGSPTASLLAGGFAALAFLTKQTALILTLPILLYLFWRNWKQALLFLLAAAMIGGGVTLIFDRVTGGWYSYYVFELLSQQAQWVPLEFLRFWTNDLAAPLPVALLLLIFYFIKPEQDRKALAKWFFILAGALAGSFLTRVKVGGYANVLLPAYAVIAILFGLGLHGVLRLVEQAGEPWRKRGLIWVQTACLVQMLVLLYNPFAQIPSRADLEAGNALVEMISAVDGEVYLPDHGYLLVLAGRDTYAHHAAIWDVMRTSQLTPGKELLADELHAAISQQVFDMIILDPGGNFCCKEIDLYYIKAGEVFQDDSTFYPVTGDRRRPGIIYLARRIKQE